MFVSFCSPHEGLTSLTPQPAAPGGETFTGWLPGCGSPGARGPPSAAGRGSTQSGRSNARRVCGLAHTRQAQPPSPRAHRRQSQLRGLSPGQSHPWGGLCAAPSAKEKLHLRKAERGPWRAQAWDSVPREARATCERLFLVGPQPPLRSRRRTGARAGGVVRLPGHAAPAVWSGIHWVRSRGSCG